MNVLVTVGIRTTSPTSGLAFYVPTLRKKSKWIPKRRSESVEMIH